MASTSIDIRSAHHPYPTRPQAPNRISVVATLARRRLALSAHNPRAVLVPLITPVLVAVVIAPALAKTAGRIGGLDYMSYVAIGTAGLVVPLACMHAGLGALVDRQSGAQPDLLAAPIPRPLVVLANLAAALVLSGLQVVALVGASVLRGAHLHASPTGVVWFAAAAAGLAVVTYAMADMLANRIRSEEDYVGAIPSVAIAPWYFAGSLFPISSLPAGLAFLAKLLPLTHAIALMRYGLVGRATSLHDIWGLTSPTIMAILSLAVLVVSAVALTALSVRVFKRAALR
jgi:ABC-type polysaccharide/polyol phosphate export permease